MCSLPLEVGKQLRRRLALLRPEQTGTEHAPLPGRVGRDRTRHDVVRPVNRKRTDYHSPSDVDIRRSHVDVLYTPAYEKRRDLVQSVASDHVGEHFDIPPGGDVVETVFLGLPGFTKMDDSTFVQGVLEEGGVHLPVGRAPLQRSTQSNPQTHSRMIGQMTGNNVDRLYRGKSDEGTRTKSIRLMYVPSRLRQVKPGVDGKKRQ